MTWTEIREHTAIRLVTPPAIWVRRLEAEHGLTRTREAKIPGVVWRLEPKSHPAQTTPPSPTGRLFNDLTRYLGEQR